MKKLDCTGVVTRDRRYGSRQGVIGEDAEGGV